MKSRWRVPEYTFRQLLHCFYAHRLMISYFLSRSLFHVPHFISLLFKLCICRCGKLNPIIQTRSSSDKSRIGRRSPSYDFLNHSLSFSVLHLYAQGGILEVLFFKSGQSSPSIPPTLDELSCNFSAMRIVFLATFALAAKAYSPWSLLRPRDSQAVSFDCPVLSPDAKTWDFRCQVSLGNQQLRLFPDLGTDIT